jgi:hypothetical protein
MILNFLFLFWPSLISRFEKSFRAVHSGTTEEPARGYAEGLAKPRMGRILLSGSLLAAAKYLFSAKGAER